MAEWLEGDEDMVAEFGKVIQRCLGCGQYYRMGIDGVADGCDTCTGVQRDMYGRAWDPGVSEKVTIGPAGIQLERRSDVFPVPTLRGGS